jgi:hypothetical protein
MPLISWYTSIGRKVNGSGCREMIKKCDVKNKVILGINYFEHTAWNTTDVLLEKQLPHKRNAALRKKALRSRVFERVGRLRQILLSIWVNCELP